MGACCAAPSAQVFPESVSEPEPIYIPQHRHCMSFSTFFVQEERPEVGGWIFTKEIGHGARSHVYSVKDAETGEVCAAKVYNKAHLLKHTLGSSELPLDQVLREIEIMKVLDHEYLLQLIEAFDDEMTDAVFLIMPLAFYGSVDTLIEAGNIDDEGITICFHQAAEGLRYMHSHNIVHRDVKPENILSFGPDYFVISDFSVSMQLEKEDQLLVDTKGSPAFLSPEECSGEPFLGKPADVWAYGVSVYSAVFRRLPFDLDAGQGASVANAMMRVTEVLATKELEFPEGVDVDPNLRMLLEGCLNKDPLQRITFEEIVKNEWFRAAWEAEERVRQQMEEEEARAAQES